METRSAAAAPSSATTPSSLAASPVIIALAVTSAIAGTAISQRSRVLRGFTCASAIFSTIVISRWTDGVFFLVRTYVNGLGSNSIICANCDATNGITGGGTIRAAARALRINHCIVDGDAWCIDAIHSRISSYGSLRYY